MTILSEDFGRWLDAAAPELDTASERAAELLPGLAQAGLFRIGVAVALGGSGGDVTHAAAAIAEVSERSLAAGFVFWGHRTFIEYLLQSPNAELRAQLLPGLLEGRRAGATGLSNAMKFLSGLEGLQIKSARTDGLLRIDGQLPWVTNLAPSGFDVAAAADGDGNHPAFIVCLSSDDGGLQRSTDLDLMALRSTNTAAIKLDDVRVGADRIIHRNATEWLPKVRPAFLGLQCAMSIGVARRSLAETRSALKSGRDILASPLEALSTELLLIEAKLGADLSGLKFVEQPAELFRLRIRLSDIVAQAVQLELCSAGGKAYLSQPGEGFQRRLRESAFIPVVTPSLVQLKAALAVHEQPAAISAIA
jgi:alkylation response protein AidB-like acyl-CoA dehydrogenase